MIKMRMQIKVFLFFLCWIAVADAAPESDLLAELGRAKSKWESSRFEDYTFEISNVCVCPSPADTGPVRIIVRDGKIQRAVYVGNNRSGYTPGQAVRRRTPLRTTVPGLFQYIEKQLKIRKHEYLEIEYDDKDGHPVLIEFDDPKLGDDETLIRVKKFKRFK